MAGEHGRTQADAVAFRFQLIGRFAVWRDGEQIDPRTIASRKGRTLLKALLLWADEPVARERLVELLWVDVVPARAQRNLAALVSRLRAALGPGAIEGSEVAYWLRTGTSTATDVDEVERLTGEARARLAGREASLALTAARRGLEIVGDGELLADEPNSDWADPHRAVLRETRRELRRTGWEAALAVHDGDAGVALADAGVQADTLDEEATRALMRAHQLRGDTAGALRAYERLRAELAEHLGVDPSVRTRDVHVALLRGERVPASAPLARSLEPDRSQATGFVGRDAELVRLGGLWAHAAGGRAPFALIKGEAGIGKTALAEQLMATVAATGGRVLRVRCYEAERSLFLGPIVELLTGLATTTPLQQLRDAAHPWEGTLADLMPELADLLGAGPYERASPEAERRRTFEAIAGLLRRLTAGQAHLVFLDDLHHAGASTLELLHYLVRHLVGGRAMVVATLRDDESAGGLRELTEVAECIDLGPLPDAAVSLLARRAGAAEWTPRIVSLTRGHTLSVVEILAALRDRRSDNAGPPPVPASLKAAVLDRLERTGHEVEDLLRAAAVLGYTFELGSVAQLLDVGLAEAAHRAERATEARMLVEDGRAFAFRNDLFREIVYASTLAPTRIAYHARAVELLEGNPEAVGWHASAAGDWPRAVEAWLEAAGVAAHRYANRDAEALLGRAIEAGELAGDVAALARSRLTRGGVREILADYGSALEDLQAAVELARRSGRPDLEAAALRALGGDVIVGLGRPSTDCLPYLEAGLDVAHTAGLGAPEVEILGRITVVWSNRTRFDLAAEASERALVRAREIDDDRALALALDAVKNVAAYTGGLDRLAEVLTELQPLLEAQEDLTLLQWAMFESALPPLARADWEAAATNIERGLAINRRTGHPWGSLFLAHRSWLHRSRGDYGAALADARTACDTKTWARHPWWTAFSRAILGWLLSDAGAQGEAIETLAEGVDAAERDGMESYLLRCTSHLALAQFRNGEADEGRRLLHRAEQLLEGVRAPAGQAFLHGAHAYAAAARLRLALGDHDRAEALLDVVCRPAEAVGWIEVVATDRVLRARIRWLEGRANEARALLEEAALLTSEAGLVPLAWEAHVGLAHACADLGDGHEARHHRAAADAHRDGILASLGDTARHAAFNAFADACERSPAGEPSV